MAIVMCAMFFAPNTANAVESAPIKVSVAQNQSNDTIIIILPNGDIVIIP